MSVRISANDWMGELGVTPDEAVLIALWNNAAFQELLADLNVARGDLIQAGLLPNPEVVYFFSVPDKPFKYALDLPLEAIWLRRVHSFGWPGAVALAVIGMVLGTATVLAAGQLLLGR